MANVYGAIISEPHKWLLNSVISNPLQNTFGVWNCSYVIPHFFQFYWFSCLRDKFLFRHLIVIIKKSSFEIPSLFIVQKYMALAIQKSCVFYYDYQETNVKVKI